MAYDLTARLSLVDNATRPLRRFTNNVDRLNSNLNRVGRSSNNTFGGIATGAASSARSVGGLTRSFIGLGAAIGGAMGAKKLFDKTILGAAKYEQSSILIRAMFQDDAKTSDFMKRMTNLASDSPVLNSQDIFATAKGFISVTKNVDKLEDMYRLVEKMSVLDPVQGTQGAALALKELLSGDAQSMVERFEMPRSVMNEIKKLNFDDQVKSLTKLLDKMGITDKTVQDIGSGTTALWNQIMEKLDMVFVKMGQPALDKIRDFLRRINIQMENGDKDGFLKFGQDALSKIADGVINSATMLGRTFDSIFNDPEFVKKESLIAQAGFIMGKLYESIMGWIQGDGKSKLHKVAEDFITISTEAFNANAGKLAALGTTLGVSIGGGVLKGVGNALAKSPLGAMLVGALGGAAAGSVVPGVGTAIGAVGGAASGLGAHVLTNMPGAVGKGYSHRSSILGKLKPDGSHSAGLSRVPYDGYIARTHQDEAILNRQEAKEWREGKSNGVVININGGMHVRKESDIDNIARQLARRINTEGGLIG